MYWNIQPYHLYAQHLQPNKPLALHYVCTEIVPYNKAGNFTSRYIYLKNPLPWPGQQTVFSDTHNVDDFTMTSVLYYLWFYAKLEQCAREACACLFCVITWPRQTIWLIGQSGSPEITTTQTSTCIRMERRVPDSTSLHSSITEEDLEDARQRLLLHQEENGTEYTTPLPPHQPVRNQTQYGSVSTIQSSQTTRPPATSKSYRLPFLILLVFDFGLIVFLSIICSVVGNT